jgi:hypothetical protein
MSAVAVKGGTMGRAPATGDEIGRLKTLHDTGGLDTAPEPTSTLWRSRPLGVRHTMGMAGSRNPARTQASRLIPSRRPDREDERRRGDR